MSVNVTLYSTHEFSNILSSVYWRHRKIEKKFIGKKEKNRNMLCPSPKKAEYDDSSFLALHCTEKIYLKFMRGI